MNKKVKKNKKSEKNTSRSISWRKTAILATIVILIIAAAILAVVFFNKEDDSQDDQNALPAFSLDVLPTKLSELVSEGKIVMYDEYNSATIETFEKSFSLSNVEVQIIAGYYMSSASKEATAFEFENDAHAKRFYDYLTETPGVLSSESKAELRGKHVIYGEIGVVDSILSKFMK